MTNKTSTSKLRAVGYSRTSGEGQRDNTSIPRQRKAIEKFSLFNEWKFLDHYVDESISGKTIEKRDAFKQMMKDAANGKFDIIVVYDITRFARDAADIIGESRFLKSNFGIHVIDTKGYDTRDHRNILMNFVKAGVSEAEKLTIMERVIGGRISNAENGLPWTGSYPVGRGFEWADKKKTSGKWFINEKGERLQKVLERYVQGEPLTTLAREFGFAGPQTINAAVRNGQLSSIYKAPIVCEELGIDKQIPVPAIPQIITPELERRVRERAAHNRVCNKSEKRKYLLTGFIRCTECDMALTGQLNGYKYYRHYRPGTECSYRGVRIDIIDDAVLDYLYSFFLDEPLYTEAIKAALPSADDREALEKDIKQTNRQLAKVKKSIANLVNAIAGGADVGLLLDKENELKSEKQILETRLDELNQTLANMPDPEHIQQEAMMLRLRLVQEHQGKDWRKLDYDDIRRFLHFLFSDNPRQNGYGIYISRKDDKWHITFKGCIEFYHDVVDGRPISHAMTIEAETMNAELKRDFEKDVAQADKAYQEAKRASMRLVKPKLSNELPMLPGPQALP